MDDERHRRRARRPELDRVPPVLEREILGPPVYVNILLGSLGTLAASAFNLAATVRALPDEATWSAAGIGRFQLDVNALAMAMGGHVRVGLEDNVWLDRDRTVPATNEALVSRVVDLARILEREPATPNEARATIGLAVGAPL
jgi:3-keto-5-aminohexanoate cleavage enzyme